MVLTSFDMNPEYPTPERVPSQEATRENSLYDSSEAINEEEEDSYTASSDNISDSNEETIDSSLVQISSSLESNVYIYSNVDTPLDSNEEMVAIQQINTEDLFPYSSLDLGDFLKQECSASQVKVEQEGNYLPTLDEHDNFNLNFELNLNPHLHGGKNNWYYSSILGKVFVKLDKTFYIDVIYQYNPQIIPKNIRCMIVYSDGISEKVSRCNNHLALDTSKNNIEKHSVMRSDNPNIAYNGDIEGKNVKDRLSVLIPLSCVQPNENNTVKQSISLKFVCQNSCTGRRHTAVIFTLENEVNQVLAKRIMHVKVCSCPKRDKNKDEVKQNQKRAADKSDLSPPPGKRPFKVKEELNSESNLQLNSESCADIKPKFNSTFMQNPDGTVSLNLKLPKLEAAQITALSAFNAVAGLMTEDPLNSIMYTNCLKELKALRKAIDDAKE